jgi:chemotaxis protein methyltransferase CheR
MITIKDNEFKKLTAYIKANYGINLKEEKRALVNGRLQGVLAENGFKDFEQYYEYILSDKTGNAITTLINKITTNHTYFMREEEHFYYVRDNVLPFLTSTIPNKDLRIWSAGCSSGEEPYTLAMLIDDFLGKEKIWWDAKILATDISSKVLEKAKKGVYQNEDLTTIPSQWRLKYFKGFDNENSVLTDKIKNEVIFRKFNLMEEEFPFRNKFHVIFCRNVMIYFDSETRRRLVNKFYDALEYGGYLFIGHSESINRDETKFKYVKPAIYRKE